MMNGKSAFPALSVTTMAWLPSALISVIASTMGLAADLLSSPRWKLIEAITSSAVSALPEWKVTPSRILKRQVAAPSEPSQLSAISGISWPSEAISVRKLCRAWAKTCA